MVKPRSSIRANTPPAAGLVVHCPPHSMIFAACQVGPGGIPRMRAKAAETAVSVARPASTTSAPARSACSMGSWPIMATMCAHRRSVAASSGPLGGSA